MELPYIEDSFYGERSVICTDLSLHGVSFARAQHFWRELREVLVSCAESQSSKRLSFARSPYVKSHSYARFSPALQDYVRWGQVVGQVSLGFN